MRATSRNPISCTWSGVTSRLVKYRTSDFVVRLALRQVAHTDRLARRRQVFLAEELEQVSIGRNRIRLDCDSSRRFQAFLVRRADRVGETSEGFPEGTLLCRSVLLALYYLDDARHDHRRQRESFCHSLAHVRDLLIEVGRNRMHSGDVVLVVVQLTHP